MTEKDLEKALRLARQRVFEDSSYEPVILSLKEQLKPFWDKRQAELEQKAGDAYMRLME